jgi:hypothetical protein
MQTKDIKRTTGTIALWETSSDFSLQKVIDAFAAIGYGKAAPNPRTSLAALKAGMQTLFGRATGQRLAPLGTGYAVLTEEVDEVTKRVTTTQGLTCWLEKNTSTGREVLCLSDERQREDVEAARQQAATEVDGATVSNALVGACESLGGVAMRSSGGVYWMPESATGRWETLAKGIEAASAGSRARCYSVRTSGDPESVRAIADAFTREADALVTAVEAEVADGASGKVALARAAKMADLFALAEQYEQTLGTALAAVKARVEAAQGKAARTALDALDF